MTPTLFVIPMMLAAAAPAAQIADADNEAKPRTTSVLSPRVQFTDEIIRQAVRDVLAEEVGKPQALGPALRAQPNRYDTFAALVEEATVPDCLHSEGLKRQPTGIGPFQIKGYLALPFVAVAKLRGKCQ